MTAQGTRWRVVSCEMGDDLVTSRCHVEHRCSDPGSCNVAEHYCSCEWLTVERVTNVPAKGAMTSITDDLVLALERVEAAVASQEDPLAIRVWAFRDAPELLRAVSVHGGDEDWLAVLPPGIATPAWMVEGGAYGRCSVTEHELVDGRTVVIGAHA